MDLACCLRYVPGMKLTEKADRSDRSGRRPAGHRVLAVDDDRALLAWLDTVLTKAGYEVKTAERADEAHKTAQSWSPAVVITDLELPDLNGLELTRRFKENQPEVEVVVVTGHGSVARAVEAMQIGAHSFVEKPVDQNQLLAMVGLALEKRELSEENRALRRELDGQFSLDDIIGRSAPMKEIFELLKRVAPTDANVLIVGESGVGKELVANAIHAHSERADRPFVKINCASFPKDLIESELFGYKKGAFTGATTDRTGLLKAANGGSVLLDEIGEMPADLQTRLLRTLQTREFRPVGSNETQPIDFRLISATNVDIDAALSDGRLREDLYFRINTITVQVPPLRERPDDIPLLCQHFLQKYRKRHGRRVDGLAPDAYQALLRHHWPGNIRELEHTIERGVLVAPGDEIRLQDLPSLGGTAQPLEARSPASGLPEVTLQELERMAIVQALQRTEGNKQEAAHRLGVYRQTLYSKIKKYGLEVKKTVEARSA